MTEQAANKAAMAVERCNDAIRVPTSERLAKNHGVPHVRRWFHLGNCDGNAFEIEIENFAARQNLRNRMAQHFADPQLALRGTDFMGVASMS
jgi:hypothetical protein